MVSPNTSLATLRPDLAGSFEEFDLEMNDAGFIAGQVAPVREVSKPSGVFGRIPLKELLNRKAKRRTRGGYQRSSFEFEPDSYETFEYGLEEEVDDKELAMYRDYFELEQITARRVHHAIMSTYEERVAALLTDTGAILNDACAETWRDYESATPLDDIEVNAQAFFDTVGMWPNGVIMPRKAFRNLRQSVQILDRIKHSGIDDPKTRKITRAMIADLFDVDNVWIANAVKNTANEGQSASLGSIWDNDKVILVHVNPSPDHQVPTVCRTFNWKEDSDLDGVYESYRDETARADVIRGRHQTGEKRMYALLARIITGVNAAP